MRLNVSCVRSRGSLPLNSRVNETLDNGHAALGELLLGVTASSVGDVDSVADVDVVSQRDVLDLNTVMSAKAPSKLWWMQIDRGRQFRVRSSSTGSDHRSRGTTTLRRKHSRRRWSFSVPSEGLSVEHIHRLQSIDVDSKLQPASLVLRSRVRRFLAASSPAVAAVPSFLVGRMT